MAANEGITHSTSVPLKLASPLKISITGSGSFQSHLSTTNSQQRLRAAPSYVLPPKESLPSVDSGTTLPTVLPLSIQLLSFLFIWFPSRNTADNYTLRSRSWRALLLKWITAFCSWFSVIYMTTAVYKHRHDAPGLVEDHLPFTLDSLSIQQRLSRISPLQPPLSLLDPFLIQGENDPTTVTACTWTQDHDLQKLAAWVNDWPGPISLVMTTTVAPQSSAHETLFKRLEPLKKISSLSLHLLHVELNTQASSNMYLNLARLFAPTGHVVLFPGDLSNIPARSLYTAAYSRSRLHFPGPSIISTQKVFPFSALSPLYLPQNHSLWCTERFFFATSRADDWEECLWQFWLDGAGVVNITQSSHEDTMFVTNALSKIQRRLRSKFRSETCDTALRQLEAVENPKQKDKRKVQWLKRFCRESLEIGWRDLK